MNLLVKEIKNPIIEVAEDKRNAIDFIVIGTQETILATTLNMLFPPKIDQWKDRLACALDDEFELKSSIMLSGIVLILFVRRNIASNVTGNFMLINCIDLLMSLIDVSTTSISTGIANIIGNKGAVALRLTFQGHSYCFVNSHLAGNLQCYPYILMTSFSTSTTYGCQKRKLS